MSEKIEIYFGGALSHFYELGYLTTDLYQLSAFGAMIEKREDALTDKFFGERAAPINRYSGLKPDESHRSEVVEVRKGSVVLIAGATLAATIIMPIVAIYVNQRLDDRRAVLQFNVSPRDPVLRTVLNMFENGDFGFGEPGLALLFAELAQRGYDVTGLSENIYRIESVARKYERRMVRTIRKHAS